MNPIPIMNTALKERATATGKAIKSACCLEQTNIAMSEKPNHIACFFTKKNESWYRLSALIDDPS
jgi:hypothetical protein